MSFTITPIYDGPCMESNAMNAIADKRVTVAGMAEFYFDLLMCQRDSWDCGKVNRAIMERWSQSALIRIKKAAWKLYEKRRAAAMS